MSLSSVSLLLFQKQFCLQTRTSLAKEMDFQTGQTGLARDRCCIESTAELDQMHVLLSGSFHGFDDQHNWKGSVSLHQPGGAKPCTRVSHEACDNAHELPEPEAKPLPLVTVAHTLPGAPKVRQPQVSQPHPVLVQMEN